MHVMLSCAAGLTRRLSQRHLLRLACPSPAPPAGLVFDLDGTVLDTMKVPRLVRAGGARASLRVQALRCLLPLAIA